MTLGLSRDFFLQWHLTQRCNLSCSHCYQEGAPGEELSTGQLVEVMDEAQAMLQAWRQAYGLNFVPSCNLTGGEPLLRSDLYEVIAELTGRSFSVHLLSNGVLIDREAARRLADLGVAGVQVSLEGPSLLHEAIRGEGSFNAARRGVGHLVEAGLAVTLNTTFSRSNLSGFGELVRIARDWRVGRLGFSRLVPVGRGRRLLGQALQPGEVAGLHAQARIWEASGLELVSGDPLFGLARGGEEADQGPLPLGGCAAGLGGLTIMPDGGVMACRRLPLSLGNVLRDSLRQIWAAAPLLEALRDRGRYQGNCGQCPRWAVCRGCRAIALAQGGHPLADDPGCYRGLGQTWEAGIHPDPT